MSLRVQENQTAQLPNHRCGFYGMRQVSKPPRSDDYIPKVDYFCAQCKFIRYKVEYRSTCRLCMTGIRLAVGLEVAKHLDATDIFTIDGSSRVRTAFHQLNIIRCLSRNKGQFYFIEKLYLRFRIRRYEHDWRTFSNCTHDLYRRCGSYRISPARRRTEDAGYPNLALVSVINRYDLLSRQIWR